MLLAFVPPLASTRRASVFALALSACALFGSTAPGVVRAQVTADVSRRPPDEGLGVLLQAGLRAQLDGRHDDAVALFDAVIERAWDRTGVTARARYHVAVSLEVLGDVDGALAELDAALQHPAALGSEYEDAAERRARLAAELARPAPPPTGRAPPARQGPPPPDDGPTHALSPIFTTTESTLWGAGFVGLGLSYGIPAILTLVALDEGDETLSPWLLLPVVGPFIAGDQHQPGEVDQLAYWVLGAAQMASTALFITGLLLDRDVRAAEARAEREPTVTVLPAGPGVLLSGSF